MNRVIARHALRGEVERPLGQFGGVLPVGPQQVGKTTLARTFVRADHPNYFDLESPAAAAQFRSACALLQGLHGLVVIDEVQHAPDLFPNLLMFKYGKRVGVEFKRIDAPSLTPSMRIAMGDLKLDALYVAYPGDRRYALADRIEVVPLAGFAATA